MYHVFSNVIQVRSQLPQYRRYRTVGTYGRYRRYLRYLGIQARTSLVTIARQPIPDPELAKETLRMRMRPA